MTIKYLAGNQIQGLSSDTKPTDVPVDSIFIETDKNGKEYVFDGSVWQIKNVRPYESVIYKAGTVYKAIKHDGTILASSTVLDGVVQAALDGQGIVQWIPADFYQPSTGHTGWIIPNDTTILISPLTPIIVNSVFANTLWKIDDTTGGDHVAYRIRLEGGQYTQGGATPSATWTFMDITSASNTAGAAGVQVVTLRNIYCKRAGTFIKLNATTGSKSYINGNTFENFICDYPHEGIVFNQAGAAGSANQVINRNHFSNIIIQGDPGFDDQSQYALIKGTKDISGTANHFYNCRMWDVTASNIASNITNKAVDTVIIGGLMTQRPYDWEVSQDFGIRTWLYSIPGPDAIGSSVGLLNPLLQKTGLSCAASLTTSGAIIGDGLLAALGNHGTGTYTISNTTSGGAKRADTGGTTGVVAGFRAGTTISIRYFNPFFICRFKLNQTTNQRIFIGFANSTSTTHGANDDPLVNLTGFGLYHSTTHGTSATNWLSARNTGSANSTFVDTGVAANNTNSQTLYIAAYEQGPKWVWRVGTSAVGSETTTIPGQTTGLAPGIWIATTADESKTVDLFSMFLKHRSEV